MIPKKTVQEIIETAKIEDVVQDYVSLKRRGVNMIGLCPFHDEKTPSFTVSPSKNIFKCFGCGKGGDSVKFLMEHENMTYPDALRHLANKYNIEIEEYVPSEKEMEEQKRLDSLFVINQFAYNHFIKNLFETDKGKSIGLSYFKERGFLQATIKKFGLGFALDGNDLTQKATDEGFKIETLKELGLTTQYDRDFFRNRVMFPIHGLSGKPVAFGGRILQKNVKAPKYLNSPESEIYNKRKTLYGIFFAKTAIRKADECILVEGYTDVISLHQGGLENVVASSGTSLTPDQIRLIRRFTPNIKILYDADPAGIKAALRGMDMILEQNMNVKVVLLPEGEDPDSYLQNLGSKAFEEYLKANEKDFILFKTDLLLKETAGDPVKRTKVLKEIVESIAKIPDPIKRSLYVKECSSILQMDEQILVNETNKRVGWILKKRRDEKERSDRNRFGEPPPPEPVSDHDHGVSQIPTNRKPVGDEYQEKDIARILIAWGDKVFENEGEEDEILVAEYILSEVEDVIDYFDNTLYHKIVMEAMQLVNDDKPVEQKFFINHNDKGISELAIDVLQPQFEYSPGWEKRDIFLNTQKEPDENFVNDTKSALYRFKLKKLDRYIEKNHTRIKEEQETGESEKMMQYLQTHQKLIAMRKDIAEKLRTVILK